LFVIEPLVDYFIGMDLIKRKISQAFGLLQEMDIDLWLVFVRETSMMADPVMPLVVGEDATWQSFFAFSRDRQAVALVGNFDRELFTRDDRFTEVQTYIGGAGEQFRDMIKKIDPRQIAVNYSTDNPAADGLTHGMYHLLKDYLADTPYADRLISAGDICAKLRSRKLPAEIELISKAARATCSAWENAIPEIATGMTEIEIAAIVDDCIARQGGTNSFHTIVNAGDKSAPGHGQPSEAVLEAGDLLHVDFGVRLNDYCSDIQRLVYFKKPDETSPPPELHKAFDLVMSIIDASASFCRPGMAGWEVDALARKMLTDQGYPEYQHALGHHLGRDPHDGGGVIGPKWERYGSTPMIPLEEGNVFTLELEIMLPGIGCVGLEEDVALETDGCRFLCRRQEKLIVV
jgi:Xaa-Pro aminopeptidase